MILVRWSIDARFGHITAVIDAMVQWQKEIGSVIGWQKMRLVTGFVGAIESKVQTEVYLNSLAELNEACEKLATIEAHQKWSKDLEPFVVSGTNRWEIFHVLVDSE